MAEETDATAISIDRRRERWRRNKVAERERGRKPAPALLDQATIDQVLAERDMRACNPPRPYTMCFGAHNHGWGTHGFHCDVWAARTLLEIQRPNRKISDGMISAWMVQEGLTHGYSHGEKSSSLRTMVGRARKAVGILESPDGRNGPFWPPFAPAI